MNSNPYYEVRICTLHHNQSVDVAQLLEALKIGKAYCATVSVIDWNGKRKYVDADELYSMLMSWAKSKCKRVKVVGYDDGIGFKRED